MRFGLLQINNTVSKPVGNQRACTRPLPARFISFPSRLLLCFHERPAGVQGKFDGVVTLENVEKGEITLLIGLLQDMPKVTDGLVIMNGKNETYPIHEGICCGR